ncbi:TIR domain-containing protein [Variovorax rhizosphaerae]|uniref:TIR domain-containing protein n=1 Tax=Variovorax rhizosphaerae TaxID=1836200 RepID=A0ABU8WMM5_9BURK
MITAEDWIQQVPPPRPLSEGDQWNVFLSYRSADRAWVVNLYDVLRRYGHKVFLDQVVLVGGDQLQERLESSLTASQAGVLVWSNHARDSTWVRREYQTMEAATDRKKAFRFVPVRLDASELPSFAALRIFLDFSSYPDGPNGGELLRLLHSVVGQPLSDKAARIALELDESSKRAASQIGAAIRNGSPERLKALFAERGAPWRVAAALGCKAAEGLTKLEAYDDAVAMLLELQREFPRAIRPKQLQALALLRRARGGGQQKDLADAQEIVAELYESGERDPETLGIYASTWMERYERSSKVGDLRQARDLYAEAFAAARDDYYTGINAAAKSVLLDDLARAAQLANEVQQIVGAEPRPGDYWLTATVGEVWLIQKNYVEAARNYDAAVAMASSQTGSHKSTWRQACRLMAKLGPTADERALVRKPFEHLPDCDQL